MAVNQRFNANDRRAGRVEFSTECSGEEPAGELSEMDLSAIAEEGTESFFRFLTENSGDVIWMYDFEADHYTYASPSVVRLRGFTPEEICRQSLYDALTPASAEVAVAEISRRLEALERGDESAASEICEFDQLHKDGSVVPAEVMTTFIRNSRGELKGIIGVARDISERRRIESEKERLQLLMMKTAKMDFVSRMAGGIAHDFNNKLQSILGLTDLLMLSHPFSQDQLQAFDEIRAAVSHCAGLTGQLLATAGKSVAKPEALDCNRALGSLVEMKRCCMQGESVLDFSPASDLWPVFIDAGEFDEIVGHLLSNAMDVVSSGGSIAITTRNVAMDIEYAGIHGEATVYDSVLVEVSDTGKGMSAEEMAQVFEPFFTTRESASGLGLSIVNGLVERCGGFVTVDSAIGMGSTFRVFLPRLMGVVEHSSMSAARSPGERGGETILLVDDEEAVRRIVGKFLVSFGYRVLSAADGREALEVAGAYDGPIHMLLTDMIMPGMNGRELSEQLEHQREEVKILYISGYASDILSDADESEDVHFLGKPFSRAALFDKVRSVLG
ncbi:MAG: ATP-binding protein [Chlorobium phaeovibrioides]|nr:ATP-binding protein [Chlorobium phaeovibrioides]